MEWSNKLRSEEGQLGKGLGQGDSGPSALPNPSELPELGSRLGQLKLSWARKPCIGYI